jgi:hypothetical protein
MRAVFDTAAGRQCQLAVLNSVRCSIAQGNDDDGNDQDACGEQ